jgi:putative multicomponent Na+:H+ antiporter subunit B
MTELCLYAIAALLPLIASMLVFQSNPYNALILRGILGAVAALVYAILGAADVALTEALMGTLLAITLYAVELSTIKTEFTRKSR